MYKDHVNPNNPLGSGGAVIHELAAVLSVTRESSSYRPRKLAKELAIHSKSSFHPMDVNDASAFASHLLDVVHEDANLVLKKPYVEALDDEWVKRSSLTEVHQASLRRLAFP